MQEQDTETTDSDKQVKVEVVNTADVEQLKGLYKEAGWWSENEDAVDPDLINKIIQGSFCFVVASINNKLVGMGRVISDGASDAYIQDVIVSVEFRGRGIAILIMDKLIQFLKDKKIGWVALISEPQAVSFYQKYGLSQMTDYVPFALKGD